MSSLESTALTHYTIQGGCHRGEIVYQAKGVNLSTLTKYNHLIYLRDGSIMTRVTGGSLLFITSDGTYAPFTYKDDIDGNKSTMRNASLGAYRFSFDRPDWVLYRHLCTRCGMPLFGTANLPHAGGDMVSINISSLDLEAVGIDIKEIAKPKKLTYCNGKVDFASQKGEPWPHGTW